MSNLRVKLEQEFGVDVSRLSPDLRICLERLETLESESEKLADYMNAEDASRRAAWKVFDGGRS